VRNILEQVLGGLEVGTLDAYPTFFDLYAAAFRGLGELAIVDSLGSYLGLCPSEREALAALGKALPLIYMTAHTWAMRVAPSDLGVMAIVLKPFDLDALLKTVEAAVAQRRSREAPPAEPHAAEAVRTFE
jgi:DNA-binding response OmpR family regulator